VRRSGHRVPGKLVVRKRSWPEAASGGRALSLRAVACRTEDAHLSRNALAGLDLGLLWAEIQE